MKRGLVLGGGGVVGHAWEIGIVGGLLQGGVDLRTADTIVGTSAGSIVGTRLAAGHDVRRPPAEGGPGVVSTPLPEGGPDRDVLRTIFKDWGAIEAVTADFVRRTGERAKAAPTVPEADWVAAAGRNCGVAGWPDTPLRLVSVDVDSGELAAHDAASGAPLDRALAASCAVPGMFPPITIGGRRYMDGGVRSGTSADVLLGAALDLVLIVAPIVSGITVFGDLAERCIDAEAALLKAAGTDVIKLLPLPPEKTAFGDDLMNPEAAGPARQAGHERGLMMAQVLRSKW